MNGMMGMKMEEKFGNLIEYACYLKVCICVVGMIRIRLYEKILKNLYIF